MNILAISGCLQSHSSNSVLSREAAHNAEGIEIDVFARLTELPHFNPDLDGDTAGLVCPNQRPGG